MSQSQPSDRQSRPNSDSGGAGFAGAATEMSLEQKVTVVMRSSEIEHSLHRRNRGICERAVPMDAGACRRTRRHRHRHSTEAVLRSRRCAHPVSPSSTCLPDDYVAEFHCGAVVSGVVAQVNWLFDLTLHGEDIARSVGVPWEIRERDMLLLLREGLELAPAYLSAAVPATTDICVALQIPDARPYVVHVHDGIAESRPRRPGPPLQAAATNCSVVAVSSSA